jgi:hypothetical protein
VDKVIQKRTREEDGSTGRSKSSCDSAKRRRIVSGNTGSEAMLDSQKEYTENMDATTKELHESKDNVNGSIANQAERLSGLKATIKSYAIDLARLKTSDPQSILNVKNSVDNQEGRLVVLEGHIATSSRDLLNENKVRDASITTLYEWKDNADRLMQEIDNRHHDNARKLKEAHKDDLAKMEARFKDVLKTAVARERCERESNLATLKNEFIQQLSEERAQRLSEEEARRFSDRDRATKMIHDLLGVLETQKQRQDQLERGNAEATRRIQVLEQRLTASTSDLGNDVTQLREDMESRSLTAIAEIREVKRLHDDVTVRTAESTQT